MSAVRVSIPRQSPPARLPAGAAWRGIDRDGVPPAPWLTVYADEEEDGTFDEPVLEDTSGGLQAQSTR